MSYSGAIIMVASWEERFLFGFQRWINQSPPANALMYYYEEYAKETEKNRTQVNKLCEQKDLPLNEYKLSFNDPARSWKVLYETIKVSEMAGKRVTVDITTMPRETIWTVLDLLEEVGARVAYVYQKPERYNTEWLSRDPGRPRLVYKLAGIAQLGAPTKLIILTGYDLDRVKQLIAFFEPELSFLGIQVGDQFYNQSLNVEKHKKEFGSDPGVKLFDVDAYSNDQGFNIIEEQIKSHLEHSNFIMSSLGPKPSAVALYRLHKLHPETALAYAPSGEFNPEYSYGIGEPVVGQL